MFSNVLSSRQLKVVASVRSHSTRHISSHTSMIAFICIWKKKIIAMHPLFFETRVLFGMTRFSNVASGKACDFFSTCKIKFCHSIADAMDIGESTCHLFFALSSPNNEKKSFKTLLITFYCSRKFLYQINNKTFDEGVRRISNLLPFVSSICV